MSILIFFIILFALVLVHELGHFLIAKYSGIRVDEFGIGFPPKLFGKKIGETFYSFNILPIGGFVKIFGENPDTASISGPDAKRSFVHKPKHIQIAVLFGGVFFNILFAWFLFSFGFATGIPGQPMQYGNADVRDLKVVVAHVVSNSPASDAGIFPGDEIIAVTRDGEVSKLTAEDISTFIAEGEKLSVIVNRNGEQSSHTLTPEYAEEVDKPVIGIQITETGLISLPIMSSIWEGGKLTLNSLWAITLGLGTFLVDAVTFNANLDSVAGPVGIVSLVGDASALGFAYLISFTAFISLNLAVINLFPFPALDGGRILFVLIEIVKGSPIRPTVANTLNSLGFAILLLLILAVTYSDILKLF